METAITLIADSAEVAVQQEEVTIKTLLSQIPTSALVTPDDYEYAGSLSTQITSRMKAIEAERVETKKPVLEIGRKIDAIFNRPLDVLKQGKAVIDKLLTDYRREQDRKAKEEQARIDALARKEEARLQKLAEAKAVRAEAKGDFEKAEDIRANVPHIPVPTVQAAPPKLAGVGFRVDWKAEVTDFAKLVKAVADGVVPLDALLPNDKVIGQAARALKKNLNWPGVTVKDVEIPVNRG